MPESTDAKDTIVAFLRFRKEAKDAGVRLDDSAIVQLMVAERLNLVASYLSDIVDSLNNVEGRLQNIDDDIRAG